MIDSNNLFVIDTNLGFKSIEYYWDKFFSELKIKIQESTDLDEILNQLRKKTPQMAYLPVANYFYLFTDENYIPILSATTNDKSNLSAVLIVNKDSPFTRIEELKNTQYGCINKYCTSSYFSIAILLKSKGFKINDFFKNITEVTVSPGKWQHQIDGVINGTIDCTMVEENTWLKEKVNNEKTKIIGRLDNLPNPLIIARKDTDIKFINAFKTHALNQLKTSGQMFNGFTDYDKKTVEKFLKNATDAFS